MILTKLALATLATAIALPLLIATPAHAEDDSDSGNLVVTITDGTTPAPTPTPPPPATQPPAGGTPSGGVPGSGTTIPLPVTQTTVTDLNAADQALGDDAADIQGLIYVSAAHVTTPHSLAPSGGTVPVTISVRNLSTKTITGTVDFWITTLWGWRMSDIPTTDVEALAPGETREITAQLPGPGQWTLFTAHATYTPPAAVDGVEMHPLTRENFLLVPPYFALAVILFLVLGYFGYRLWSRHRTVEEAADA